jgi:YfiH family protein
MIKNIHEIAPLRFFSHLNQDEDILHFVSSRGGGVSKGIYHSLNLSYTAGDDREYVTENRKRLAEELGITPAHLVFPGQSHSANVRVIRSEEEIKEGISETDALITQLPQVCVSVLVADCVPLLFYDRENRVVAAAHAGWRGTVQSIAVKVIETMKKEFGSDPSAILAGIGPSIGPDSYEVGENVIGEVKTNMHMDPDTVLLNPSDQKAHFDLWAANRQQLVYSGVQSNHIEEARIDTYQTHELFFSARRLGNPCGRFAAGIMKKG